MQEQKLINGKYFVIRQLGKGGMSRVYLVRERNLGKLWAMKVISQRLQGKAGHAVLEQLKGEAERMREFSHPVLPIVVDVFSVDYSLYIIMEYVPGKTLKSILSEKGTLSEKEAVHIAVSLCEALQYLHTRKPPVIYRDMKPANIMITPEGRVKLIDFGISREYRKEKAEDTICLGTKGYAAPEQFGGMGQSDVRTDIYGLGATLYHMLTGKNPAMPPYEIRPVRQWKPWLSPGLEFIVSRCTKQNPKERYTNIEQVRKDLSSYQQLGEYEKRVSKRKLIVFFFCLLCSFSFFVVGKCQEFSGAKAKEEKYVRLLQTEKYKEAISFMPGKVEAYLSYIKMLRDGDGKISKEEKRKIETVVYQNLDRLLKSEDYRDFCFQLGVNFWYWYDGELSEQVLAGYPWFQQAEKTSGQGSFEESLLSVYLGIGYFYQEINPGIGKGNYRNKDFKIYWERLMKLKQMFQDNRNENIEDILSCQTSALIICSMKNYMDRFLCAGITNKEMLSVCHEMEDNLPKEELSNLPADLQVRYRQVLRIERLKEIEEGLR